MKSLNFNKIEKRTFEITLPDENQTNFSVTTPPKKLLERFAAMETAAQSSTDELEFISSLYEICAELMSRNIEGIKIEKENLEECLDIDDIYLFIDSYMQFISEIKNQKN